jgi:hydroxyacylglutathione hydrolase
MTMIFERVQTRGIAQISYLVGDDSSGTAAVIDPRPNVAVYLEIARRHGVAITHVFETHIHADFMSGSRELVDRLGAGISAPVGSAVPSTASSWRRSGTATRSSSARCG